MQTLHFKGYSDHRGCVFPRPPFSEVWFIFDVTGFSEIRDQTRLSSCEHMRFVRGDRALWNICRFRICVLFLWLADMLTGCSFIWIYWHIKRTKAILILDGLRRRTAEDAVCGPCSRGVSLHGRGPRGLQVGCTSNQHIALGGLTEVHWVRGACRSPV